MKGTKDCISGLCFSHESVSVLDGVELLVSCGEDGVQVFVVVFYLDGPVS